MPEARVLRVFTRDDRGGNRLGVVTDLEGLDAEAMQAIAAELGYSETIFLAGTKVRIFTPTTELQFAGHPLVGAAWVAAADGDATGNLECGIGLVDYRHEDGVTWVDTHLPEGAVPLADGAQRAAHFGLPTPRRSWMVTVPQPYVVFELGDADAVAGAAPDLAAMEAARVSVYLAAPDDVGIKARFFAPGLGVPEDPATGSAAVALAAVRVAEGERAGAVTIHQGDEIDAPSTIRLAWHHGRASIGGTVTEDAARHAGAH